MAIIVILNKKNRNEKEELTLEKFKERFKFELEIAIENFIVSENKKIEYLPKCMKKEKDASDFYFDLRWNFNHYSSSEWFIERIK